MIYGVEAWDEPAAQSFAGLGMLDFVNGVYSWGVTSLTAADVVDQTGWITASGLEIPASGSAGAELIYAAMATFLSGCQFTAVLEIEILDTGFSPATYLFTAANSGQAFYIQLSFAAEWEATCSDGNTNPFAVDSTHGISTGIHKFAVTQTDSATSLSVDGNAVETDTTGVVLPVDGFPMVDFFLGGWVDSTGKAVNIRSFTLYDPVSDLLLPQLSA